MRILITRPEPDAQEIADKLAALGHQSAIAPLLDIRYRDGAQISLDGVQAILATSANGVRAIAGRTSRRDVPLFAVGPQTAAEAQAAGFQTVRNAQGDGMALARAVQQWAKPADGALLHAAGAEAPKLLASELEKHGFMVRREVLYEALAAQHLPEAAAKALRRGEIDAVALFSPRSAAVFADCAAREGLGDACHDLIALCISPATAEALAPLALREIRVAKTPDQAALLALLP